MPRDKTIAGIFLFLFFITVICMAIILAEKDGRNKLEKEIVYAMAIEGNEQAGIFIISTLKDGGKAIAINHAAWDKKKKNGNH